MPYCTMARFGSLSDREGAFVLGLVVRKTLLSDIVEAEVNEHDSMGVDSEKLECKVEGTDHNHQDDAAIRASEVVIRRMDHLERKPKRLPNTMKSRKS